MAGQGSSECVHCNTRSHWKSRLKTGGNCPTCSKPFDAKPKVEAEDEVRKPEGLELTLTAWQHGYRGCINCNKFTRGPRSEECVHCGNIFPKKGETKVLNTESEAEVEVEAEREVLVFPPVYRYKDDERLTRVYIPRGECPHRIERKDKNEFPSDDAVKAWAHKVRQTLIGEAKFVGNAGLYYWAIQQINPDNRYKYNSEEMQYLKMLINELPDVVIKKVPA